MKNFPNSQKKITVKDREYIINYPNTGQLIDIERYKATISGDKYDAISNQSTNSSTYSKFLIDMMAIFNVLCSELIKDLKVASISELAAQDSNMLLRIYIKEILPWMLEWENAFMYEETEEHGEGEEK